MAPISKTVALITGANRGIGLETAKKLATEQNDYIVVLAGRRKDSVEAAVQTLKEAGLTNVEPLELDVTSDASITTAVAELQAKYGRLDVLINNAGICLDIDDKPATRGRETIMDTFSTNVASVVVLTDACIPLMKASVGSCGPKRIVFVSSGVSSITTKQERPNVARVYSASKSALNMLALNYVADFKDDNEWKINVTCPGFCATEINQYRGTDDPKLGAVNAVRLATLGADGETGTFSNRHGTLPW